MAYGGAFHLTCFDAFLQRIILTEYRLTGITEIGKDALKGTIYTGLIEVYDKIVSEESGWQNE